MDESPGERKVQLPEQVSFELADRADKVKEGLLGFAVGVGLEVFKTLLEEDRSGLAGPKGKHDPPDAAPTVTALSPHRSPWEDAR